MALAWSPLRPAVIVLMASLLAACSGGALAPVVSRDAGSPTGADAVRTTRPLPAPDARGYYTVQPGDTLFGIAFRHGLDYRDLAAWNGIDDADVIHTGMRLRLTATPGARRTPQKAPVRSTPGTHPESPAPPTPPVREAAAAPAPPAPAPSGSLRWQWPTLGRVAPSDTRQARNGVNIAGTFGQPVSAAAPGRVVYSGSGLIGYGQLIIVKHDNVYLSAYANNSRLLVREGDRVDSGQQIAEMGKSGRDQVMLHFEIRRNGQPVDPLDYLPRRP